MTDHRALYLVIDLIPFQRGIGYWKFNTQLLKNQEFVTKINQEIDLTIGGLSGKPMIDQWEVLKRRLKETAVEFSRTKSIEDKLIIAQLSEKVNDYESQLPLNKDEDKLLDETKAELEEKAMERTRSIMFRSKVQWHEEGEKSSKYFFSLEKARYNAKTCYKMLLEDGSEVQDPDRILQEQRKFYQELYDIDQDVQFSLVNHTDILVPMQIRESQNQQLEFIDLEKAIKSMNNNKTPGQDGLPIDFYKVFWVKIKEIFYGMMLEVYEKERLHSTARKGILNLIPKANKDTRVIKNLRPITLLNTDYKIIEKAIANKMIPALEHIIHKDQRGFMKERRISVNIRKMLDIIHQVEQEDIEAVIMSLDFVKCFDKCSFSILHGSLNFFEFGHIVKEWTKILYKDFSVKIQNNGNFSLPISIKKGVHQGGCCSSVYFLVIAEILAISLRNNESIEGISIQQIRNILNQFADDMDIFSLCSKESLQAIHQELADFRQQSGFTVSYEKTTLYRIGSLRHANAMMYDMDQYTWSNEDITVLGVTIAHNDLVQKNFEPLVAKAKEVLNRWYNRGLSLIGKTQVVNTLVASLFVYKMMVLPSIPPHTIKIMENIFRDYLWKGKKAKISLQNLQAPKSEGGLNLVDLRRKDISLKATWPTILYGEDDYAKIVYSIMRCETMGADIWRCSLLACDVKIMKIKSDFWSDVLKSWCQFNFNNNFRIENQLLWYNSNIRIRNRPFFWADVYQMGLKYVSQLFYQKNFKSEQMVQEEYGLNQMRYNSLKSALPGQWKDFFLSHEKEEYFPVPPHKYDQLIVMGHKGVASKVYGYLAEDISILFPKYYKWDQDLGVGEMEDILDFQRGFKDMYKVTNVTKFRSFQFRMLQRGLVTNIQLQKWGLITSNLCSFCNESPETIKHLFMECRCTQELWTKVKNLLTERFNINYEVLSFKDIVFNRINKTRAGHIANFICLVVKQFIYSQRCLKGELHFQFFYRKLNTLERIEKYIAIKNNKLGLHVKKWGVT